MMIRRIVAAALIVTVAGCTTFGAVAAPREFIIVQQPSEVWVTHADSSVVVVHGPRFLGDTLIGAVNGRFRMIPLSEVRGVQARRPAPRRSALLIGGSLAGLGLFVWLSRNTAPDKCLPDTDLPVTTAC